MMMMMEDERTESGLGREKRAVFICTSECQPTYLGSKSSRDFEHRMFPLHKIPSLVNSIDRALTVTDLGDPWQ